MNELRNTLISKAVELYTDIFPVKTKNTLSDCFTAEENTLVFWFNTADESTHIITTRIR